MLTVARIAFMLGLAGVLIAFYLFFFIHTPLAAVVGRILWAATDKFFLTAMTATLLVIAADLAGRDKPSTSVPPPQLPSD